MPKTATLAFPRGLAVFRIRASLGRHIIEVWSGGLFRFDQHPTNHPHFHESYHELGLVLAGRGEFVHGGMRYALSPGTIFFSEINVPHEISSFRTRNLYILGINLTITATGVALSSDPFDVVVDRFLHGHKVVVDNCGDLARYVDLIRQDVSPRFDTLRRREVAKLLVLDSLDRLSTGQAHHPAGQDIHDSDDLVSRASAFIEDNLHRRLTVAELAAACFCSPRHLRRLFRKVTGKSVLDSMNERRLRMAAQQLLIRFTVAQVAESLGFESLAHFSRLFKRYHGMTAKEFQNKYAPKPSLPRTSFEIARSGTTEEVKT